MYPNSASYYKGKRIDACTLIKTGNKVCVLILLIVEKGEQVQTVHP
jgi:hypothetical protein